MKPILSPMLPAGITDSNIEIFTHEGKLLFTRNGQVQTIERLPVNVRRELIIEMFQNQQAIKALSCMYNSVVQMYKHYIICNYGGFDFEPDSSENGKKRQQESWNCGCKGSCKLYGKVCKSILTARESDVIRQISIGIPDKWISDRLNISQGTLSVHKRNIGRKLNLHSKSEMTRFAITAGL
jgi:DNA-binding CsgD family transcriptional regulator